MRSWTKLLPYFFVEWFIKKYGERFIVRDTWFKDEPTIVSPYPGTYIKLKEPK